jgi:hypothetical protein
LLDLDMEPGKEWEIEPEEDKPSGWSFEGEEAGEP